MGARCQVSIKEKESHTPVYLYSHWGSGSIKEDVRIALARNQRWDDYEYLTRILFDGMKGTDTTSETGYGIGTGEHGDIDILVEILPGKKVGIEGKVWTFDEYTKESFTVD